MIIVQNKAKMTPARERYERELLAAPTEVEVGEGRLGQPAVVKGGNGYSDLQSAQTEGAGSFEVDLLDSWCKP